MNGKGVSRMDVCEHVALVSFKKIPSDPALLADIFGRFAESEINLDMISQTSPISDRVSISFTCFDSDMVKVLAISNSLKAQFPDLLPLVSSGNCKIQLYGEEMRRIPGVFARAIKCLSGTPAEPQLVTTSEVDISLLVSAPHCDEVADALRAEFGL